MWRYLKIMLIVAVVGGIAKSFVTSRLEQRADEEIPKLVAKQQAMLPIKLSDTVELTDVSYDQRTLHYEARSTVWMDQAEVESLSLKQRLAAAYCDSMKPLVNGNVAVEYQLTIPPKTLNDRATRVPVLVHPDDCLQRKAP